jgi:hypothetical protein
MKFEVAAAAARLQKRASSRLEHVDHLLDLNVFAIFSHPEIIAAALKDPNAFVAECGSFHPS